MRVTHTYALMEVSSATFEEIKHNLEEADYKHMFEMENDKVTGLTLQGIMLVPRQSVLGPVGGASAILESMGVPPELIAEPSTGNTLGNPLESNAMCPGFIDPQTLKGKNLGNVIVDDTTIESIYNDLNPPPCGEDTNFALPK